MGHAIRMIVVILTPFLATIFGRSAHGTPLVLTSKITECDGEVGDILNRVRSVMQRYSIEAYIVPISDAHQNEYISDYDKRLRYISKFTGSAGQGIVTLTNATLWTDSRYHIQAQQQLNLNCWKLMKKGLPNVPSEPMWLIEELSANSSVGVDPFLITAKDFHAMQSALNDGGHYLIPISENIIDAVWITRPIPKHSPIIPLQVSFSGKESGVKISEVLDKVTENGAESIIITALDDIAWLLNLRGSDIEYNPLFFSYVILTPQKSYFLVNDTKISTDAKNQLASEKMNLTIRAYDSVSDAVREIADTTGGKILMSTSVSLAIHSLVPNNRIVQKDLVASIKTVKNQIEAENMEKAHVRDGLALIQYLHWLNTTIDKENITELSGAAKLSKLRAKKSNFRGLSFETISAFGEHAAMAHYSPNSQTDKQITRDDIYLIDSGGHYWDGTTDVTRTVHFGKPTAEQRRCYTRVLKGFIAVATSIFPKNTPLSYFDNVARRSLWQVGLDYGHGTGHGVGMYLPVHEYPPLINAKSTSVLQPNIFMSNEPGFYKENDFGIRIEDVIQVINSDLEEAFNRQGALTFKSITYAPLQTSLIDTDLLTRDEAKFVNGYNKRVHDTIGEILLKQKQMDTYQWLADETRQICSWAK